jgi:hypothetical protein
VENLLNEFVNKRIGQEKLWAEMEKVNCSRKTVPQIIPGSLFWYLYRCLATLIVAARGAKQKAAAVKGAGKGRSKVCVWCAACQQSGKWRQRANIRA